MPSEEAVAEAPVEAMAEAPVEAVAEVPADTICGSHLKAPEDLVSFPVFPEGQQGSLLSKFLSRDTWNEYES